MYGVLCVWSMLHENDWSIRMLNRFDKNKPNKNEKKSIAKNFCSILHIYLYSFGWSGWQRETTKFDGPINWSKLLFKLLLKIKRKIIKNKPNTTNPQCWIAVLFSDKLTNTKGNCGQYNNIIRSLDNQYLRWTKWYMTPFQFSQCAENCSECVPFRDHSLPNGRFSIQGSWIRIRNNLNHFEWNVQTYGGNGQHLKCVLPIIRKTHMVLWQIRATQHTHAVLILLLSDCTISFGCSFLCIHYTYSMEAFNNIMDSKHLLHKFNFSDELFIFRHRLAFNQLNFYPTISLSMFEDCRSKWVRFTTTKLWHTNEPPTS